MSRRDSTHANEALPRPSATASNITYISPSPVYMNDIIVQAGSGGTLGAIPGGIISVPNSSNESSTVDDVSTVEACLWHGDEKCDQPRTCRECLGVLIDDNNKCVVDPKGACVAEETLRFIPEIKSARYKESEDNYYESGLFKYCDQDDAICADWRQRWRTASSTFFTSVYHLDDDDHWRIGNTVDKLPGDSDIPSFVVGEDGHCLCIRACEEGRWEENVVDNYCDDGLALSEGMIILVAVGLPILIVIVACIVVILYRKSKRNHTTSNSQRDSNHSVSEADIHRIQTTQRNSRDETAPPLNLEGWKSHMDELVGNEQDQLRYGQATAPPASAMYAPGVVVEEGSGYRPTSPSEMNRRGPANIRGSTNEVEEARSPREASYRRV